MTDSAFGIGVDPRVAQFADLATRINTLAHQAEQPPSGSRLAQDNAATAESRFPSGRAMSAAVRGYAFHASAAAEAMYLILSHPATVRAGYRTPANAVAVHERAVIEATAQVAYLTQAQEQSVRLNHLVRRLVSDTRHTKETAQRHRETFEILRRTIATYLQPDGVDDDTLRSLAEPAPSIGEVVKMTLGKGMKATWSLTSGAVHYSASLESVLYANGDGRKHAEVLAHTAAMALEALTRLEAFLTRALRPDLARDTSP